MTNEELADALDGLRQEFTRNAWIIAGAVAAVPFAFALVRLLKSRRRRETTTPIGGSSS